MQISLVGDRQGLKLFTNFRLGKFHWEHEWLVKENQEWNADYSHLTPKVDDPTELTEFPTGKVLEPEDI